jgi:NAD(P)H-hydrate epimerase
MADIEHVQDIPELPRRAPDAHKGDFGRVLVIGGSRGMPGAVGLAANAALRGGAGLVTFAAPETVQLTIAPVCPCATSTPLSCGGDRLAAGALRQLAEAIKPMDVLAVGPGMDRGKDRQDVVRLCLEQPRPTVIDADGLNNLAAMKDWPAVRQCPLVLTPHPGEFSRLTGRGIGEIQSDRLNAATEAATDWAARANSDAPLVLVLKGAGTIVTDGRRAYINDTGNPGMATGGSGDILTGLTAALLAQGLEPFDAVVLAVYVHGRAGDLAADQLGQASMIASDLLDHLPQALRNPCP